ncbi:MAG: hypothetical protein BA862_11080 [Desulfobulbaceae bacterium S3730MH12]|nr:MAG: hypothetical protein BA866_10300 [Desulfobulbaceae bacterium S5133MH15]OEU55879.1 MAG: hypothetical protein BA862_11080 [Desulfobulbaceae bacterium S3730MH12]OEU81977.1 MAG: hypothetical protein BA873_05220 [Desulfobulbaceae bacterium C00003063]
MAFLFVKEKIIKRRHVPIAFFPIAGEGKTKLVVNYGLKVLGCRFPIIVTVARKISSLKTR